MKNIFLGLIIMTVFFLPQMSFGQTQPSVGAVSVSDSGLADFQKQQDADSAAFFEKQSEERGDFIKAHADIIAKLDRQGREAARQRFAQNHPGFTGNVSLAHPAQPLSSEDSNTWQNFTQKQLADKQTFLAKQAQDRQKFLSSQPSTSS